MKEENCQQKSQNGRNVGTSKISLFKIHSDKFRLLPRRNKRKIITRCEQPSFMKAVTFVTVPKDEKPGLLPCKKCPPTEDRPYWHADGGRMSPTQGEETIAWLKKNCFLFKDIELPKDFSFRIMEVYKRIGAISNENLSNRISIIKHGNMFSVAGEKFFGKEVKVQDVLSRDRKKKDVLINEILCEGDVIIGYDYLLTTFRSQIIYDSISTTFIAGLPEEKKIEPVEIVEISLGEVENLFFTSVPKSRKCLSEKSKKTSNVFIRKVKDNEQLTSFLVSINEFMVKRNYWDKVKLYAQITNSSVVKISLLLYQAFYGEIPMVSWKTYSSLRTNEHVEGLHHVLKKPRTPLISFVLRERTIWLLTGLSHNTVHGLFDSPEELFKEEKKKKGCPKEEMEEKMKEEEKEKKSFLSEYLRIEYLIEDDVYRGAYKFSLNIPELEAEKDIMELNKKLTGKEYPPFCILCDEDCILSAKRVVFSYVVKELKTHLPIDLPS